MAGIMKRFNRPLNETYRAFPTFKLNRKRNINLQNDFMENPSSRSAANDGQNGPIRGLSYIFSPVNTGFRDGVLVNNELVTGQEVELKEGCVIINKPNLILSVEKFGGLEPFLLMLTRISSLLLTRLFGAIEAVSFHLL